MTLGEGDAWVIAYPDHVAEPGRTPLASLSALVRDVLAPAITGVHTLPVHPASGDGGFSVIDPAAVDPRFGSWDDLRALAGITSWMADAVVNHLSATSPWFVRYLAGDPRFADFFATLDPSVDASAVVRPRTSPLSHAFPRSDGTSVHVWTTFSADQVDLDYRNPAVLAAMSEVIGRFVDAGAAAVRLDAIAFVWKDPATSSVNQAGTHEVVRALRADIDRRRPGVLVVTETNLPHDQNVSYLAPGEADAVYQFPLPPLVAHAFVAEDAGALVRWLQALTFPEPPATYLDVLATHDGIGVRGAEGWLDDVGLQRLLDATAAAGGVVNRRTTVDGDVPYELAVSWFALLGAGFDEATAIDRHLASHAIALAVRGHPLLYLNSLFGSGNDEATFARTGHARDLNRGRLRRSELDAALREPSSRASRVWAGLRSMLAARASSTAFHPAAAQVVHERNPSVVLVERVAASGERAWVAVNVTRSPIDVDLPDGTTLTLAPFGWHWRTARFTAAASGCHDRP